MYELYITGHRGLSEAQIDSIPGTKMRRDIKEWVLNGADTTFCVATGYELAGMRTLQETLAKRGIETRITHPREEDSGLNRITRAPEQIPSNRDERSQLSRVVAELGSARSQTSGFAEIARQATPTKLLIAAALAVIAILLALLL